MCHKPLVGTSTLLSIITKKLNKVDIYMECCVGDLEKAQLVKQGPLKKEILHADEWK